MEMVPSGTMRSGSISRVAPRPWQAGQAPCGLLNEKTRGWISGSEMPQCTQANFSLKVSVGPSASSTSTRPSASWAAVSTESVSRRRSPSFITSRSTMTATSCLYFLSRSICSSSSRTWPSTLTRAKPSARSCWKSLPYSPLRPRTSGASTLKRAPFVELADLVDDLLDGLSGDGPAAVGAVRVADARVEQAQVVVDLGDGADRRARVARGRLLLDGDGRREALDRVDVGLVHLPQELAGVGRERLDVAALALGVDGVEGERRLARAGEPGDDDEPVARQPQGDVLEVVLARARDDDVVVRSRSRGAVSLDYSVSWLSMVVLMFSLV